jgi:putative transposase
MGRPRRIEIPGGFYHVGTRGNNQDPIVHKDRHRRLFFAQLAPIVRRQSWIVYAYCLMSNHYHLVFQIGDTGMSSGMRDLNGGFAREMNRTLGRCDHFFGRRYWSELLCSDAHLLEACRYTDLNPCAAGLCGDPGEFVWSGYRAAVGLEVAASFHAVHALYRLLGATTPSDGAEAYGAFVRDRLMARKAA